MEVTAAVRKIARAAMWGIEQCSPVLGWYWVAGGQGFQHNEQRRRQVRRLLILMASRGVSWRIWGIRWSSLSRPWPTAGQHRMTQLRQPPVSGAHGLWRDSGCGALAPASHACTAGLGIGMKLLLRARRRQVGPGKVRCEGRRRQTRGCSVGGVRRRHDEGEADRRHCGRQG